MKLHEPCEGSISGAHCPRCEWVRSLVVPCPDCDGTGEREHTRRVSNITRRVSNMDYTSYICPSCAGRGVIPSDTLRECGHFGTEETLLAVLDSLLAATGGTNDGET